jgi:hypothetical protein
LSSASSAVPIAQSLSFPPLAGGRRYDKAHATIFAVCVAGNGVPNRPPAAGYASHYLA